jgi:deoxyribonuclease V
VIACFDVDYKADKAHIGGVLIRKWTDAAPFREYGKVIDDIADYVPGQFYKRELPCIIQLLDEIVEPIDLIVVDGYVWLTDDKKGLGAYLYEALNQKIPVIGVAKNWFKDNTAIQVLRGESKKPLFVTAAGFDAKIAAKKIEQMDGEFRNPTILKQVDQLCRAW